MRQVAAPQVAVIAQAQCIGCMVCVPLCPTDAIVGAPGFIHGVIADLCTGCAQCVAPCPAQCITLAAFQPGPTAVQERRADGRFTPRAIGQLADVVRETRARRARTVARATKDVVALAPVVLPDLPAHLQQRVGAARAASAQLYAAKGPLKTPKALRKPRGPGA